MGAGHLFNRVRHGLAWRGAQMMRHLRDEMGRVGYALQRRTGGVKVQEGAQLLSDRLAIYTVFPVTGIQRSHHETIAALAACGYAVLVVSNLPLTAESRAALAKSVWRVMERPNFGYDFGAYREGVRYATQALPRLQRLIFCNDSVWFPLPGATDWPLRAEATGCDLVGAVSNYGIVIKPDPSTGADWIYDPTLPEFHYCSFALSLGPTALQSDAFRQFWQNLRLTNDKFHTVRRGEVGLSRALLAAGLRHTETFESRSLGPRLQAMSVSELRQFIAELVIPEDRALEQRRQAVLAQEPAAHAQADLVAAACHMIASTGPAYALPAYAYEVLQHPFLKKSPLRLLPNGAAATLRLTARLQGPYGQAIHAEAKALAASSGH